VLVRQFLHLAKVALRVTLFVYVPLFLVLVAVHYPYDVDRIEADRHRDSNFYERAYSADAAAKIVGVSYEDTAEVASKRANVEGRIRAFVRRFELEDKRVLEVGSGRGYLQDLVEDYTGLDLSPSVASKYHKPFVVASATNMPFPDNSFDAAWSVWVLEHISQPEKALSEIRRVLKPGGKLYLSVAWNCEPWLAGGFKVRPYEDFTLPGKLVKASIPLRSHYLFEAAHRLPNRYLRWAHYSVFGAETRLRFQALQPNYDAYWEPDSDAAISLDVLETVLWFRSRGDECLNCKDNGQEIFGGLRPIILEIRK
jgi:SAM-dependent methyltransferase